MHRRFIAPAVIRLLVPGEFQGAEIPSERRQLVSKRRLFPRPPQIAFIFLQDQAPDTDGFTPHLGPGSAVGNPVHAMGFQVDFEVLIRDHSGFNRLGVATHLQAESRPGQRGETRCLDPGLSPVGTGRGRRPHRRCRPGRSRRKRRRPTMPVVDHRVGATVHIARRQAGRVPPIRHLQWNAHRVRTGRGIEGEKRFPRNAGIHRCLTHVPPGLPHHAQSFRGRCPAKFAQAVG